jgi:excisionase family DNA binding protein
MNADELLTVADVAKILNVPVSWVYDRTRRRGLDRLPHLKLGKYVRFQLQEILHWLDRNKGN